MTPSEVKSTSQGSESYFPVPKGRSSATWSPQSRPNSAHLLQRKPSIKLVPLISRFEALDTASLDALATQELHPAPLQLVRKRTRLSIDHNQQLPTIFSPDIRREEDDVFTDRNNLETAGTSYGEDVRLCDDQVSDKGVLRSGRSLDVIRSIDINRTSKSIKDRIRFFDRALPAPEKGEHSIVRHPSKIFHTTAPPTTPSPHKEITTYGPESSQQRLRPIGTIPITPNKLTTGSQASGSPQERKRPAGIFPMTPTKLSPSSQASVTKQPMTSFGLSAPSLPTPPKPKLNYTPSPPKVKLSDVYTDNSHLPARGRALLRKDTILPGSIQEKIWSPPESYTQTTSPFKEYCRGQSIVPTGSNHRPIHSRRRNLSDKVEAIYRERRKNSPLRISNNDGENSRQSSWSTVFESPKPVGKIGSKIASLRRLFDGSFSKDSTSHLGFIKTSKAANIKQISPYIPHTDLQGFQRTSSVLHIPNPKPDLESESQKAPSLTRPSIKSTSQSEKQHALKSKIGDKIKLFESIAKGKEKIERQFRGSNSHSSGTIRKFGKSFSFKSGPAYSFLKGEDMSSGDAEIYVDRYDGKKERENRSAKSKVGLWSEIQEREREKEKYGGKDKDKDEENLDLIIKEVECGLRQPKPLRLAEMKRMKALCKGFQERISASREKEKERGKDKDRAKVREKSGDSLRIRVPV